MSRNGNNDIPGAPSWVRHFLQRVDDRFDVMAADLELATKEFRGASLKHGELEERVTKTESEIAELKRQLRSLTPPGGIPSVAPPDDAA